MNAQLNSLDQPVGAQIENWATPSRPPRTIMDGQYCRIEPLDIERHASDLYAAFSENTDDRIWTYMVVGPFDTEDDFRQWLTSACLGDDPLFHTIINTSTGKAAGLAAFMRIDPAQGAIEVGSISFSPALQQTAAATEAMFLMMRRAFSELGYRRYEWKCDDLNAASRRAAERLGFSFEGVFRQAVMYKGRNRDTAWYSILDKEWPVLELAYSGWLDGTNFDAAGHQKMALGELIAGYRLTDQENAAAL